MAGRGFGTGRCRHTAAQGRRRCAGGVGASEHVSGGPESPTAITGRGKAAVGRDVRAVAVTGTPGEVQRRRGGVSQRRRGIPAAAWSTREREVEDKGDFIFFLDILLFFFSLKWHVSLTSGPS
jgi:hypothetical protein